MQTCAHFPFIKHFILKSKGCGLGSALAVLAVLLLCPIAVGQTNWSIEGGIPSYGEYNFPNPMALTNPMPYVVWPAPPPGPGPVNLPFPVMNPFHGGSAVDIDGNPITGGWKTPAMIHSDGFTVEMTDPANGAYLTSYPAAPGPLLPGTISGVAYDSKGDITWLTDGTLCIGVGLPPAPGVIPPVIFPPFPLPLPAGAPASGLGWDSWTGTLWFCDLQGLVTNCTVAGVPLVTWPAIGLGNPLMGCTVNSTNGNVQVTDGNMVAEYMPPGPLAAPGAFYLFANPFPIAMWAAPVSGIGQALRPQRYGAGYSPSGTLPPAIASIGGYSWAGNPSFTLMETGATPGAAAKLIVGFAPAIPGLPLGFGATLWVFPIFQIIGLGAVPASGTVFVSAPLPPPPFPGGAPVGAPVFVQFVNVISNVPLVYEMSDALSFTVGQN